MVQGWKEIGDPFCAFCGSAADDDDVVSARARSYSTAYVDAVMQMLAGAGNYWRSQDKVCLRLEI